MRIYRLNRNRWLPRWFLTLPEAKAHRQALSVEMGAEANGDLSIDLCDAPSLKAKDILVKALNGERIEVTTLKQVEAPIDGVASTTFLGKLLWDPKNTSEVELAQTMFQEEREKGHPVYQLDDRGRVTGSALRSFDDVTSQAMVILPRPTRYDMVLHDEPTA